MEDVRGLRSGENHPTAANVATARPDRIGRINVVFRVNGKFVNAQGGFRVVCSAWGGGSVAWRVNGLGTVLAGGASIMRDQAAGAV